MWLDHHVKLLAALVKILSRPLLPKIVIFGMFRAALNAAGWVVYVLVASHDPFGSCTSL